jgi:hypothetical protein
MRVYVLLFSEASNYKLDATKCHALRELPCHKAFTIPRTDSQTGVTGALFIVLDLLCATP